MNHQPFETWLLEEEPLTMQQDRELQSHIRTCTSCSAIADSNLALHSTRLIEPVKGFTDRFQTRLADWRKRQIRRQALGTVVLVLAGVVALYALAGPAMIEAARSPAAWLARATSIAVSVLALGSVLSQVAGILVRVLPGLLPPGGWLAVFAAGSTAVLIWSILMRGLLARAPRGASR